MIDAHLVHRADLVVDDAAHPELLRRGAGGARGGDVGDGGDAARKRVEPAEDGGIVPVGRLKPAGALDNREDPRRIGHVVDDAAQNRFLEARVKVDQPRHDRG